MSWWHTGAEEAKKDKEDRVRRKGAAGRFWLKVGESRKVLFAEDVNEKTFGVFEHELKLDGEFKNIVFSTCVRGVPDLGPCFVCGKTWGDGGKGKEFARLHRNFCTIFDLTPWQRPEGGDMLVATKRILAMKQETYELLCGKSAKRRAAGSADGLKGWVVDISRLSQTRKDGQEMSPKVGNDFEPVVAVTDPHKPIAAITMPNGKPHPGLFGMEGQPIDPSPFDWREMLKPRTKDELEKIFGSHSVADGSVFGSGSGTMAGGTDAKPSEAASGQEVTY